MGTKSLRMLSCFVILGILFLLVFPASVLAVPSTVAGMQDGWVVDPSTDTIIMTLAKAQEMASGGAKWVRVPFRLGGHNTWDSGLLAAYDTVVNNCVAAGLTVIGLVNHESWGGQQKDWTANNNECLGGTGDNTYMQNYVNNAVLVLAQRYHPSSKVVYWEIWNEPDVWTNSDPLGCPANRNQIGGSYIYPSNFAWALRRSYEAFKTNGLTNAKVISGGLLCADFTGTCNDSGGVYLTSTYTKGTAVGGWNTVKSTYGSYPVDGWGQHMYVSLCCRLDDPSYLTTPPFLIGANYYKFYLDCYHNTAVALDSDATKKTYVTEWGWPTNPGGMSTTDQAFNIGVACDVYNSTNYIGGMTYFTLRDQPAAGLYYGLRNQDDSMKLAWTTFCSKNGGTSCNPPPSSSTTIVTFNDRADGALNGTYQGLDWGNGVWAVGGPWGGINSKNAFLNTGNSQQATGRINGGTGGVFKLISLKGSSNVRWTITLHDNNGQNFTQTINKNQAPTLNTGWAQSSLWVDFTSSVGNLAVIDDVTYSR